MCSSKEVAEKLQAADIETLFIVANQFSLGSRLRMVGNMTVTAAAGAAGYVVCDLWRDDIHFVAVAIVLSVSVLAIAVLVSWRRSFLREFNALIESLPKPLPHRDPADEKLRTELIERILRYRQVARVG